MVVSALFFPFWLTTLVFLLGVFFFDKFYLGLVILLFMDAIYGFETLHVGPFYGMLTVFGILAYLLIVIIKDKTIALNRYR